MAMPALMRCDRDTHLRSAAEHLCGRHLGDPQPAIDSGLIYQFLYEPGGRRFVSIPYERESAPGDNRRIRITSSVATDDLPRRSGELPVGLVFSEEGDDRPST